MTVVPAPEDRGAIHSPGFRFIADLEREYVEEEFLVSGAATVFTYSNPPVRGEIFPLEEDVPFTTRIIVRRPASSTDFNGTVIIEWWNSTATFDTAPVWDASAEYFARKGIVYVGVTNSTTSIDFLKAGCALFGVLPPTCGDRYAALSMPENGQAFEMVSQIATLLKSSASDNPLPGGFAVERIFHAGQSQQGGSMVTYASAFHFPVNDGYFIQAAGTARPINSRPACDDEGSPPYPDCTPRLQGEDRLVRRDLPVPVYRAQTETDMARVLSGSTRQSDSANFRYYEMAGTAHTTVHDDIEVIPAGLLGPDALFLEDACAFPFNTIADGPIFGSVLYNAMWENMELQVRFGIEPPHGELIEVHDGAIARDRFGNARGGIRVPQMDVPVATYGPSNTINPSLPPFLGALGDLLCRLSGTVTPFDDATLDALYPSFQNFVKQNEKRAEKLVRDRFLLPDDVPKVVPRHVGPLQRACIVEMNRRGAAGVLGRQNSDNERCVRGAGRGALSGVTVDKCVTADLRFGIAAAEEKLVFGEATQCLADPAELPDFGYPGDGTEPVAAFVAKVAREQSRAMLEDLFGSDLDAAIVDAARDRDGRRCQAQIVKAADDVLETMIAEAIRAKSAGLKDGSILDAGQLAQAISGAIYEDDAGRIESKLDRFESIVEDQCLDRGVGLGNAVPGRCGPATGKVDEFTDCIEARARCRACLVFNGIDDLDADCDDFDDGELNTSCASEPNAIPRAGTIPTAAPEPDDCITDTTPGLQSLQCDGLTFQLSVPDVCVAASCGLIVDVHGFGMNAAAQDIHTNLVALGKRNGYIVVQPTAPTRGPLPSWAAGDDPGVRAFMERVMRVFHVQEERVHMTGYSQGGWMTWRFACHAADLLASVAPLAAGSQSSGIGCFQSALPPRELDIFYVHGTTDNFVSFASAPPMREGIIDAWGMQPGTVVSGSDEHEWTRYFNERGTIFEFAQHDWKTDLVFGAPLVGHCFPGSGGPIGCGADTAFHWGEAVMRFFIKHPRD